MGACVGEDMSAVCGFEDTEEREEREGEEGKREEEDEEEGEEMLDETTRRHTLSKCLSAVRGVCVYMRACVQV
jgi:hypothetical protein